MKAGSDRLPVRRAGNPPRHSRASPVLAGRGLAAATVPVSGRQKPIFTSGTLHTELSEIMAHCYVVQLDQLRRVREFDAAPP